MDAEGVAVHMPGFDARNEALVFERLAAFGLIEADGEGGWRMTDYCKTGLAAVQASMSASPSLQPGVVHAWRPRKL